MNKEIKLPRKGRLIVVTDIHGNYSDYEEYLKLWNREDKDSHIVFAGDLIHSTLGYDQSVELIDDVIKKTKEYDNFHVLLGNHEWAHITDTDIFKNYKNQKGEFEKLIEIKKGSLEPTLSEYIEFFKTLPYFIKTENGVFISHTGPSRNVKSMDDYEKIFDDDYENPILYDFLWNRPGDYTTADVDNFLDIIGSNCMIIGHNVVDGFKKIGNQIIITSNYHTDNKTYFDINLERQINSMDKLMEYMKFL